jgi:FKBP-type peptidyl-prolyl cis-trans isomerase
MQKQIKQSFKKYIMFGFTGTPIFGVNASGKKGEMMTTADVFGGELDEKGNHTKPLHTYTIINAINDKNVLKFNVEYHTQTAMVDGKKVENTNYLDSKRIALNVKYLLDHFDMKTKRSVQWTATVLTNVEEVIKNYKKKKEDQVEEKKAKVTTTGFNSILACDSVPMAIEYYKELERQMAEPSAPQLRIATIFTSAANEAENDSNGNIEEDPEGIKGLDSTSREFLDSCITKYNHIFGTSYNTSAELFQNYYKDLSMRTMNKEKEAKGKQAKADGEKFLKENAQKEGVVTTASGLQYMILEEGDGKSPKATDKVRCHYEGMLIDGTLFDSSLQRGEPADFPLNGVIAGWTEGLQLMKEGAKYRFFIPYLLGYGAGGAGNSIPPYSTLIFDVELIKVL